MRAAYRYLGIGIATMVLFQVAVLAFGTFAVAKKVQDGGTVGEDGFDTAGMVLHGIGAVVLSVLVLAMLVVSFLVRVEGAVRWALIVLGLTVLQWALAAAAYSVPAIGLLHGLVAFAIAAAAGIAGRVVRVAGVPEPTAAG